MKYTATKYWLASETMDGDRKTKHPHTTQRKQPVSVVYDQSRGTVLEITVQKCTYCRYELTLNLPWFRTTGYDLTELVYI